MTDSGRACLTEAAHAARHLLGDALFVTAALAGFVILELHDRWQGAKAWLAGALEDVDCE